MAERAEPVIARDPDPPPNLEPAAYREKYAEQIGDGVDAFLAGSAVAIGSPFIIVPAPPPLANQILGGLKGTALDAKLDELLTPAKVSATIEKNRVHGRELVKHDDNDPGYVADTSAGPDRWYPDIAAALGALMVQAMRESLARVVPRYLNAAAAKTAADEAKNQRSDATVVPAMSASDVVASAPMDVLVIGNALAIAAFDYQGFRVANPDARGAVSELHDVTLVWEAPVDGTYWVRAKQVADPKQSGTVEDVANALFGTPTKSARLTIVSPPLFGFAGASDLLPEWQAQLQRMGVEDKDLELGDDPDRVRAVAQAEGPIHEEMAKSQGADIPTKAVTKLDVLRLLDDSLQILGSIDASGATYGMGKDPQVPGTAAVRAKLNARHASIMAGSEEDAAGWAGQAQGQRDVLTEASFAMQTHAKRQADMTAFEKDSARKAGGFNLPSYVRLALHRVASEFASAVAMSDLPATAMQMLATAEDDAGQLPIEIADGMIAGIQRQIDDARESKRKKGGEHGSYGVDEMREREEAIKVRLARIRETMQSNPAAAEKELDAIRADMQVLGDETQMVADMDEIDATWQALDDAMGFFVSKDTNDKLDDLKYWGDGLHRTWMFLYDGYRSGTADRKDINRQFEKLRGDLARFLQEVPFYIHDAQVQSMVGKFAALIVITIVTDGLGDIVLAGAEGWGLSAGAASLVAGGAEAAAFTTLNQIFLDDDHGIGHIALDFVMNVGMFSAMRRFALFAKTAELSKAALVTRQTLLMAGMTIARAELEKVVSSGRLLDRGEIAQIAVQGIIQAIAMHAIAPTVKPMLFGELENSAYAWATQLRANNATQKALTAESKTLAGAKDLAAAQAYVAQERAWVAERLALLDDIARTAEREAAAGKTDGLAMRLKLTPEQIRDMRVPLENAQAELADATVMANLEPKGPGMFSCPAEHLDAVIGALKGEVVGTNTTDGARTVDVKLPDGSVVKVTEVVDGSVEWVADLRTGLSKSQLAMLDVVSTGKSPRDLYLMFKGDPAYAKEVLDLAQANAKTDPTWLHDTLNKNPAAMTPEQQQLVTSQVAAAAPGEHIGDTVDTSFQTEQQRDLERWQTHGLEDTAADPGAKHHASVKQWLAEPQFRHWYDVWMSMPDRVVVDERGNAHVNLPNGVPPEIATRLKSIAEGGNLGLMTRALDVSRRISEAFPDLDPDPGSAAWQAARPKIVELLGKDGEAQVAKYESEHGETRSAKDREAMDKRLGEILADGELAKLQAQLPGAEIYVTGSAAQAKKPASAVSDLDVIVVVPKGTPPNVRAEMEGRLQSATVQSKAGKPMAVDAKVMTPEEFMGFSMNKSEARTPLENYRVDVPTTEPVPGTGESGGDLHNHIMGVPQTQYFIDKVGEGSAVATLEKVMNDLDDPALWKNPANPPVTPGVHEQLKAGYADVLQAKRLHMDPAAVEARARRVLQNVMSASEHTPFDATYDVRDLLVQKHIDPAGPFQNYATDVIEDLHDQGVTYSEQSVSAGKLEKRFTPEAMDEAHRTAQAHGKDSEMKFLVMEQTGKTLAAAEPPTPAATATAEAALEKQLMRPDVTGMDIAGPENKRFTETGMAWFTERYRFLERVARQKGERLVLRPHVGEGYDPGGTGEHVEIAQENLRMILETLKELGYDGTGDVIVRLGHATHATPAALKMAASSGVIVEANVGSNIATGSVMRAEEHPLLQNMYYGVKTVLSTDAQGVMNTTLPAEYGRAAQLIARFKGGEPMEIDGKKVNYADLPPEQQARFSVDWLQQQLADYKTQAAAPVTPMTPITPVP
jgi:adenosine deaminase